MTIPAEGRFWDESTGSIIGAQAVFRETLDHNLEGIGVIMDCGDSRIADALFAIANSLGGSGGSGGNCGVVNCYNNQTMGIQALVTIDTGEVIPLYGEFYPAAVPEVGYPDGYTNAQDYKSDKCAKSYKFVGDLVATLRSIGNILWFQSLLGVGVLAACLIGVITVPYAAIPVLLFVLLGTEALDAAAIALANEIENSTEEWVCAIYKADGVEAALLSLSYLLSIAIATINPTTAIAVALKQVLFLLVNTDSLNFVYTDQAINAYPQADCAYCDQCSFQWYFEEDSEGWAGSAVENGNIVVTEWASGALGVELEKVVAGTGVTGLWEYYPADNDQEWIATEGDEFVGQWTEVSTPASGIYITIYYTDETFDQYYQDTAAGLTQVSVAVTAGNTGKQIDHLTLNGHIGQAAPVGSSGGGSWDNVALYLSQGCQ